jgi:hypothetical protein
LAGKWDVSRDQAVVATIWGMNARRARQQRQLARESESPITSAHPLEVRAALESLSPQMPWAELRDGLRPVFIRRRPLPPGMTAPITRRFPPGLDVALGVDIGPAFMYVSAPLLDSWGVGRDEAFEVALANLRSSIESEHVFEMAYEPVDDVPVWWYQSRGGLASGLLLLDDILVERYGDQPRVLLAPMRNLLLAAPFHADRDVLEWLREEISHLDPNGLDLPMFALVDGTLTIDERATATRHALVH